MLLVCFFTCTVHPNRLATDVILLLLLLFLSLFLLENNLGSMEMFCREDKGPSLYVGNFKVEICSEKYAVDIQEVAQVRRAPLLLSCPVGRVCVV